MASLLPNVRADFLRAGHQLRRHPTDPLPRPQQRRLEVAREVAAILDRPLALNVQTIGEGQQLTTPVLVGRHRPLGQLPPRPGVDSHRGVRAHVRIDPDHDHQPLLPRSTTTMRTAGGQHIVKATKGGQAPIKSHQRSSDAASDMTDKRSATASRGDMQTSGQPAAPKLSTTPDTTTPTTRGSSHDVQECAGACRLRSRGTAGRQPTPVCSTALRPVQAGEPLR